MAKNKYGTALVTGASSGLGRGLALWFAKQGTRVFAAARRREHLQELAEEARATGGTLEPVEMDVSRADETFAHIQRLDADCGGLDLLVANAGVGQETNGRRFQWERAKQVLEVNVMGTAATLSAVLPRMVERKRGHLVAVSSLAAFRGLPKNAAYSGSKAFLTTFMESLRVDLKGTGVRVTCIHPGFVKSAMTAPNKHPMPFLLETQDAVERMARAIERGVPVYRFPWQMSAVMKVVTALPDPLFDAIGRKVR
ncbi:SDR family NAD(P)-dependent oxidoreductase [Hyalangium versicolor]|uniref:SDR family NAD(P)-dependent oxidoreductase n=1 Tax=Hyalangium versicolor TaxID=2861190 RepID=UPI001CCB682A|nr:SDR family NAD(P)-dependent oxidoreductase [Hyalangium versicolor]